MSESKLHRSNLDLVNEADDFPIPQRDIEGWLAARRVYYHLRVDGIEGPVGMVHPEVAEALRHMPGWRLDEAADFKTITVVGDDEWSRSKVVAETFSQLRYSGQFAATIFVSAQSRCALALSEAYGAGALPAYVRVL